MIIKHRGIEPKIDPSSYIAPTATVIGNVTIGAGTKVMFGAVINSEGSKVTIGEGTVVSENVVIRATAHGDKEHPVAIGENVFIGPHATILGGVLKPCCYIATGATVLHGAKVSSGSVVAVGGLVHADAVVPKDFFVPPYAIAIGDPVRLYGSDDKEEIIKAIMGIGFSKVAFDIDASGKTRAEIHKEAARIRADEYEAHFSDQIISKDEKTQSG
ncbi:MAG: gamma carbonic anhydrase family protein [Nitrospirota bacterium]|jgi:carbonic anhydrase/acetyltransferase-like protein (isoleucine patch superfamily)